MHTNIKSAIKSKVKTGPALTFTLTPAQKHTRTEEITDSSYHSRVGGLGARTHTHTYTYTTTHTHTLTHTYTSTHTNTHA